MDKDINHIVNINQRKSITISGVKKIDNFSDASFLLETNMGFILIKGSELEIIKLDTFQGDISIKGKIDSLSYQESSNKKNNKESVISKLFKWYHYHYKLN